jgi:hypothetical protein
MPAKNASLFGSTGLEVEAPSPYACELPRCCAEFAKQCEQQRGNSIDVSCRQLYGLEDLARYLL